MEAPKAPQLSAYDFLGYIVPGLASAFLMDASYRYHFLSEEFDYQSLCLSLRGYTWSALVPMLMVAYFLGHIVSFVSSIVVEKHAGWMHGRAANVLLYGATVEYLDVKDSQNRWASKGLRVIVFVFMLPVAFVEIVVGKWLGMASHYIRKADVVVVKAFYKSMSRLLAELGLTVDDLGGGHPSQYEMERLAIHCGIERAPSHVYTLRNYVVLYGFLRSMCFVLHVAFWAAEIHFLYSHAYLYAALFFVGSIPLLFACYAGYLKFVFRYNYEAIMAMIATASKSRSRPAQSEER